MNRRECHSQVTGGFAAPLMGPRLQGDISIDGAGAVSNSDGGGRSDRWPPVRLTAILLLTLVSACVGCDDEEMRLGRELYRQRCAECHEGDQILGPALTGKILSFYRTPETLLQYVSTAMPYDAPGTLSTEQYGAVVGYLIEAKGAEMPALTRSSAPAGDRP